MTILGIIALIAVIVLGLIVLRVKSDPLEKKSVRKILADAKPSANVGTSPSGTNSSDQKSSQN
jgi:hypothetical protein